MAKIRKSEMTVPYTEGNVEMKHKVQWTYATDPMGWSAAAKLSFFWTGLQAASKAIVKAEVLQSVPAVKLYNSVSPMIEALKQAAPEQAEKVINDFLAGCRARGERVIDKLPEMVILTEEMFTEDNPQLIQAENESEGE